MTALVSFEAAARNGGFKAAASELNVTPAAVSHQIKALEEELNCPLFHRHHRGVELTETGAYLLVALQRGFDHMHDAVEQLRVRSDQSTVTIRATTAVSSLWLTPLLAQFWQTHGHVSVAQIVSDRPNAHTDCDLSIQYGDMSKEVGRCQRLLHGQIMVLASPGFAVRHPISEVSELANTPLIHLQAEGSGWTDWHSWCAAFGYFGHLPITHRVNNYVIALQAAQDNMGAVLGWSGLTQTYLDAGRLVKLLPHALESPLDFYVKLHPGATDRAKVVFNWLVQAAGENT